MDLLLVIVGIYLVVGVVKALRHLNSGRVGTEGPLATFIAVALLWPFV